MSDQTTLPMSWMVIPLPIAASINPPKGKIEATESELAHFVPMACVQVEFRGIDVSTTRPLREVLKGYTSFQEGDVLFAKITPCMENGKLAVVPPLDHRWGFGSTEFHVLRASEIVLPKWIAHFVSQASVRRDAQRSMTGTAGQLRVPALWLNEQELPIPPLAEQSRIVAKIEELFSDLDAGVAALKRAKANLKRYRASVLKASVEGKLTEQWRAKHPAKEPASALLARILKERRLKWEADQLAKFAAAKKEPPKNWRDKYVEPTPPDTTGLPELAADWTWASVQQVGSVQLGRQRAPQHHSGQYMRPYLRVANVFEDRIDTSDVMEMNFTPNEYETYRLGYGDILLNEGQSMELVGRPAIYRDEVPGACFTNTLVRFRVYDNVDTDYALRVFLAYLKNGRFQKIATITVNIAHLGAGRFAEIEFPLPPIEEQAAIIQEVDRHFSLIDAAEATIEHGLFRASRLRQSILKRAFEGKLVPQDPKDEPATALLKKLAQNQLQSGNSVAKPKARHQKAQS
jgi:type I restriction enzyme, S subunit